MGSDTVDGHERATTTPFAVAKRYLRRQLAGFRSQDPRRDAMAGLVLGVESVPDGLAQGLLAGVNPVSGLYGYLYGQLGGAFVSGTALLAVQGTGAMSIIVAEQNIGTGSDSTAKLATLTMVTGVAMLLAAYFKLASLLRYVSAAVMTGFASAVGINILLGQLADFTGYQSKASSRLFKGIDTLAHVTSFDLPTLTIGVSTLVLVVVLGRTALGPLGLVFAVAITSAVAALFPSQFGDVKLLADLAQVSNRLPWITLPNPADIPGFILPGVALAFVGLLQGAAITQAQAKRGQLRPDNQADFAGEGAGNITSGLFQGIPVGGSFSATQLVVQAGGVSRLAFVFASVVMWIVILFLGGVVGYIAMPALAALLLYVGWTAVHLNQIRTAFRIGHGQAIALVLTLLLTTLIPLHWAVLIGVAVSIQAQVVSQANSLTICELQFDDDRVREVDPPRTLASNSVVVLQHYGGLYFASVRAFEDQLPRVTEDTHNSVVVFRSRGIDEIGGAVADMFHAYIDQLQAADCKLVIVTNNERFRHSIEVTGVIEKLDTENMYHSNGYLFESTRAARADALDWVNRHAEREDTDQPDQGTT